MNVIWDGAASGEGSTVEWIRQELASRGEDLALPSIRTMLTILQSKRYLGRRKDGRRHVYEAKITREASRLRALSDLVSRSFGGSSTELLETLIRERLAGKEEWEQARKLAAKGY